MNKNILVVGCGSFQSTLEEKLDNIQVTTTYQEPKSIQYKLNDILEEPTYYPYEQMSKYHKY